MATLLMTDSGGQTQHITVGKIPLLLGSGEHCDVVLGSRSVTREHMKIWEEDEQIKVEDLTGGMGIRKKGVAVSGVFELTPQDTLEAGLFVFQILDSLSGMPTALLPANGPGQLPYLCCLKGKAKGEQFTLRTGRNDIGRDPEAWLSIEDPSISRRHASLFVELPPPGPGGKDPVLTVSDLNSSNGTFLNRLPVTQTTPLKSGDILSLGKLQFRFVFQEPQDGDKKQQRLVVKIFLGVVALIVLVQVTALLASIFEPSVGPPTQELAFVGKSGRQSAQAVNASSALVAAAQRAMHNRDWMQAEIHVDQILGQDPSSIKALELRGRIQQERSSQQFLDQGLLLGRQGNAQEALAVLGQIPETSAYAPEVRTRVLELKKQLGESLLREGKKALRAGDLEKAHERFRALLSIVPCDTPVPEKVLRKLEADMKRKKIPIVEYVNRCKSEEPRP